MKLNTEIHLKPLGPRQRRAALYLFSFAVPFLILTLACLAMLITPFGKHNLCITDARYYINGQMFLARLLKGQENWLYSLKNGLGGNEWSQLAWGAMAPASVLALFAKLETIPSVFTWICVVNLSLCGLTMYILLAHLRGHRVSNLIFSTSYALMGFNVVNCYQTGFFQGPQLLPLMVLGLLKLVKKESPLLYILSLAVCIFTNFYFGFMLCVASVILFAAILAVREEELKGSCRKTFLQWGFSSLIAGLLAAPMWLPALKAYSGGDGRLNQTELAEFGFSENMPFLQMFSKLFSGANSTNELVSGMPNIFCGILVVALVILFFMNREIPVRNRRVAGVVLVIYLLSFYITAFTLLMHGGTHTNWFPYRYSYVFSFLLISIAAEQYNFLPQTTLEQTKRCGLILLIGTLLVFQVQYEFISAAWVLLDLSLLLGMWYAFYLYKTQPEKAPMRIVSLFVLLLTSINLYANFILSTRSVRDWEKDLAQYYEQILESGAFTEALSTSEDGFFRMEKDISESGTLGVDGLLYNYYGVGHSGPTERMFVHKQLNRLGINWYDMRHWYAGGIPAATDALLGLKYLISERDLKEEKGYIHKVEGMKSSIYIDPYCLPVSILTNAASQDVELGNNCFNNLNQVWKSMTGGKQNIFIPETEITFTLHNVTDPVSLTSGELSDSKRVSAQAASTGTSESGKSEEPSGEKAYIEYTFTAAHDGPVYIFNCTIPESVNGISEQSMQCIGVFKKGETVSKHIDASVEYINQDIFRGIVSELAIAYADNSVLAEYAKQLNKRDITFNVEHENQLNGTFTAEKNQRILFTLPWDEGWTCYIDGEKVPIDKTWDLFMSVEAPEGAHTWEMKFFPAWMDYGLYLSGAALVGLVVLMVLWKRSKNTRMVSANHSR